MPPDNGPVTKADLNAAIESIERLIENELKHQADDIGELQTWRDDFMAEGGPWRSMDKRVINVEHFAEDIKGTIDRMSKLFYSVLTVVITSLVLWIITMWPKLVALLQGGP